jgi:hypothetical protein
VETLEHQESSSGQRLTDLQLIKTKKGEFSCTLEELIAVNLGLALYGTTVEQTSGTVTGEALPNPVTVGSLYLLARQNVSSVVVKDASATPKALPATQVSLNARHGSLTIIDKTTDGPFVEPFTVDYAYDAAQSTAMFTQPLPSAGALRGAQYRRWQPRGGDRSLPRGDQSGEGTLGHHRRIAQVRVVGAGPRGHAKTRGRGLRTIWKARLNVVHCIKTIMWSGSLCIVDFLSG